MSIYRRQLEWTALTARILSLTETDLSFGLGFVDDDVFWMFSAISNIPLDKRAFRQVKPRLQGEAS